MQGSGRPKNLRTLDPTFNFPLISFILKHNIYTGSRDADFLFAISSFPTLVLGQDRKIPFILLFAALGIFSNLGDGCHNVHGCRDEITGQAESSVEEESWTPGENRADQSFGSALASIRIRIRKPIESNQC
jgi:hypothetical protein